MKIHPKLIMHFQKKRPFYNCIKNDCKPNIQICDILLGTSLTCLMVSFINLTFIKFDQNWEVNAQWVLLWKQVPV